MGSCYDCKHQCITETSYEWIECFCKAQDDKRVEIQDHCPLWEEKE